MFTVYLQCLYNNVSQGREEDYDCLYRDNVLITVFYANIDQSPVSRAQSRIYFIIMVAHVVFSNP